ncbi:MAG: MazG nucleotide pyrophosphohydrolase domain-containing protein [Candidatus Paceibacterota bacterium]|jgi:NTP pyrophosphatase (non-canonical NTP hydrolase)
MEYQQIQEVALRVKNKYTKLEIARMGREWNLSEITEGFVGDVGDLMKLVMAKEGKRVIDNVDEKLKEEITDCLWSIICIAKKLNIDVEKEFVDKMSKLDSRVDSSIQNPAKPD